MIAKDSANHYDVVIIGAGISGINFAYRLQEQNPELSYTILEGRDSIGGTWDLFKYPGIRSDSDLYTFGFPWRPWTEKKSIAEGPLIVNYVKESAAMYGIDKKIQFRQHVSSADWSSETQTWTLAVEERQDNEKPVPKRISARFMLLCTGYYDYNTPLQTVIPGLENFQGKRVHPQFWPQDLDYTDKNITIIGSGATAITLLPSLAEKAKHVTMLQRSPSFILSIPHQDGLERLIRRWCPKSWEHRMIRLKWLLVPWLFVNFCRLLPDAAKNMIRKATLAQLPDKIKHDPHFVPRYNPFEQRMCFCPDGDFYAALRSGKAEIVTDTVDTVTADTIKLTSGQELHPDIIVTATGLKVRLAGGIKLSVDSKPYQVPGHFVWKAAMLEDLPNTAFVVGYVDASWTLGADATANMVCRLLRRMQQQGYTVAVPRISEQERKSMKEMPVMRLSSTYVQMAQADLPKAGDGAQWRARSSYFRDWWESRFGDLKSGMQYLRPS